MTLPTPAVEAMPRLLLTYPVINVCSQNEVLRFEILEFFIRKNLHWTNATTHNLQYHPQS